MQDHLRAENAEKSVLGAILLNANVLDLVHPIVTYDDFYLVPHKKIYERLLNLAELKQSVDLVSLIEILKKHNELEEIGGESYLLELSQVVGTWYQAENHAKIVFEAAEVRRLIQSCALIIGKAQMGEYENPSQLFDLAQQMIMQIGSQKRQRSFMTFKEAITESINQIRNAKSQNAQVTGTSTGFEELDQITAGFQPGELIILAARPGMGKTALALNMGLNAALNQNKPCTIPIFSLEMPTIQLAMRMLASEALVSSEKLKTGAIDENDAESLMSTVYRIQDAAIFIDDSAGISIVEARAKCRRLAADPNLPPIGMVIVDYLQLMKGSPGVNQREQEISDISRNLKALAKELKTPVVALSQLNRGVESRPNKRPLLSDLRESGAIEQDADMILFVYRDEYYNPETTEEKGIAELIIAKNRSGSLGTCKLKFFGQYTKFQNYIAQQD
jgi:replicative DNA helicase